MARVGGEGGAARSPGDDPLLRGGRRRSAWEAALKLLALRARSSQEVRRRLARGGHSPEEIESVLRRLTERGYLDDAAYAAEWVRLHQARRGLGPARLARELQARGLPEEQIRAALQGLAAERPAAEAAAAAAARRLPSLRGLPGPVASRRLAGYLARRGFSTELILTLCRRHFPPGGQAADTD